MGFTRHNNPAAEDVQITLAHAATTSTLTTDTYVVPTGRNLVIDGAFYIPAASLAASDSAYVVVTVLNGSSTTAATYSTKLTGGTGALTAGTGVVLTLSGTAANINVAGGTVVRLSLVCTSSPSVGAGSIRIKGRLL